MRDRVTGGAAVLLTLAVLPLSGCTVASVGYSAVSVDETGHLVGVVAVCAGSVDGMKLTHEGGHSRSDGKWLHQGTLDRSASFTLGEPGNSWQVVVPFDGVLDPDSTYTLFGWTEDNSATTDGATFTRAQIESLEPGTVLHSRNGETVQHFKEHACDRWR